MSGGGPPGLSGGATGGGDDGGFGHVGEAGARYSTMARVLLCTGEVRDHVEADSINVEKYVKEIAALVADLTKASGRMFEQEHLRMINMVSAPTREPWEAKEATGSPRKGSWSTRSS